MDMPHKSAAETPVKKQKTRGHVPGKSFFLYLAHKIFGTHEVEYFDDGRSGGRGLRHGGKEYVHHSGLHHTESALYGLTSEQKMWMLCAALLLGACFTVSWQGTLIIFFALLTFAYFADL
jgi:hypothetical protein